MRLAPPRLGSPCPASPIIARARAYDAVRRPLDLVLGLALVPVLVPVIALAWLAVRLTSRGPGFYTRLLGRFGRPYRS